MRDLEGEVKEQPFLWFVWTASGTTVLPELSRVPPSASLVRLACVQLYARGYPPDLQITKVGDGISKVGDSEKLMLVPSVQVDSILSSRVPVCPVFLHGYFMPISPLTACPAVLKLNTGL